MPAEHTSPRANCAGLTPCSALARRVAVDGHSVCVCLWVESARTTSEKASRHEHENR